MNEEGKGLFYWMVAGLGLGVGLWLVTFMVAFLLFATNNISEQYEAQQLARTASKVSSELQHQANKLKFQRAQVVTVRGDTVKNCLRKSGGVADEEYERCRSGYHYTWTGTGPAPTK